jgi:hypothetical protein
MTGNDLGRAFVDQAFMTLVVIWAFGVLSAVALAGLAWFSWWVYNHVSIAIS